MLFGIHALSFALLVQLAFSGLSLASQQPVSPPPPQPAERLYNGPRFATKRAAAQHVDPLIASRQVKAQSLRNPLKAKRACPSFLPNGNCVCPAGLSYCDGDCQVVTYFDTVENCGECGRTCPPTDSSCFGGTCICDQSTYVVCNNACVDPTTAFLSDNSNCGKCGHACTLPSLCVNGGCKAPNELYIAAGFQGSTDISCFLDSNGRCNVNAASESSAAIYSAVLGASMQNIALVNSGEALALDGSAGEPAGFEYNYLSLNTPVPPGQPTNVNGFLIETSIWSLNAVTGQITGTWINPPYEDNGATCPISFGLQGSDADGYSLVAVCSPNYLPSLGYLPAVVEYV